MSTRTIFKLKSAGLGGAYNQVRHVPLSHTPPFERDCFMHRTVRRTLPAVGLLLFSATAATTARAQLSAYAVATSPQGVQQLVRFNPLSPGSVTTLGPTGANLTGIDFRPATGMLYGYDGNLLYMVNVATGAASFAFDVGNTTGNAGFDFNPTVDRIRVVDAAGTNLRLNPFDGSTLTDMSYSYAMGDVNFGRVPSFTAVAYTNPDNDPATGTTLFGIDQNLGQLIMISNPNGGTVATVGSLGIGIFLAITGFDIVNTMGNLNVGFFSAATTGSAGSQLYSVNLATGAASLVGAVGLSAPLQGLALTTVVPEPGTWAMLAMGLASLAAVARRRGRVQH